MCQCPLGLIPHFYSITINKNKQVCSKPCQCPLGLIPHFYVSGGDPRSFTEHRVNALSGLYLISTQFSKTDRKGLPCVNALSGLYLISTKAAVAGILTGACGVNALSGLYLISTNHKPVKTKNAKISVNALSGLYLISTDLVLRLSSHLAVVCQCPLGLIPHFYRIIEKKLLRLQCFGVSMPSRAYTSFLRYPFKNLGFMRFPEPVFAGIYQNILTTAVFRAC